VAVNHDIRHWAQCDPDKTAVRAGAEVLSYGELEAQANRLARVFASRGLRRGDHIVALLPNVAFMAVAAWAACRSGLYFTPASTSLTAPDAAHIVDNSRAKLVIADGSVKTPVAELPACCAGPRHWLSHGADITGYAPVRPLIDALSDAPREDECTGTLMLYTSGTTGAPKGVWRPLQPVDFRGTPPFAADLIALWGFDESVRYLSTAPIYHAAPMRTLLAVTAAGGSVVMMQKFDAQEALQLLTEHRITHSQWVPTMFQRLLHLSADVKRAFVAPDHVKAIHGAAPCPIAVKRAMIEWWGPILLEYYSGSEGVGLTMIDSFEWLAHPGSVGKAMKGVPHVLDDAGNELPAGKVGQIFFSGVPAFQYFEDPEKTAARASPQGYQTLGDIGYVDGDGYMYLTDRMDDMIISGGVNVYPQEIESALFELREVIDAGVVGMPDADFGERPIAFVVGDASLTAAELEAKVRAHCEMRLGRIKAPVRYVVLELLPRSPTGKLLRRELRERVRDNAGAAGTMFNRPSHRTP
jgi:acyl-CoA synthetase (AMP-forming)/AMP-acid ligase II